MPSSTRNLTLDFMETQMGQYSSFKLNAILGLKYNHENKYSHNFLVQFQNINTKFTENIEISPELLRYKFKLGNIYKQGKLISNDPNELTRYLEIDTQKMHEQQPLYKVLSKESINHILGNKDFYAFQFGGNSCYVHEEEDERYIIPSSVMCLYYYFRSSSMKDALHKGKPFSLYDEVNSNLDDKDDAILVLESHASKLDGPFIYRFLTSHTAQKGFVDFSRYIASYKAKQDFNKKLTSLIPIKALFPTRETFNIFIRYVEIEDITSDKKTYLVNEIKNDDSTLDFEKLTILKKKRKDGKIDLESGEGLHVKGRKPKKRNNRAVTRTPALIYGTNKIREIENTQNLSLMNKDVTYGSLEEENGPVPVITEDEKKGDVSVSFSQANSSGDESSQQSTIETKEQDDEKEKVSKPATFDIFLESIDFIENSGLVSEFVYNGIYQDVLTSYTQSHELTSRCSIDGRVKRYVTCSFEYNDIYVVLIEVESENHDFATWVMSSKNEISDEGIEKALEMRYSKLDNIDTIKESFDDINTLRFTTHRHAPLNDENDHEEVLERWLLRLLYKLT
jgi:hypothetical protein